MKNSMLLLFCVSIIYSRELIINGTFDSPLFQGWDSIHITESFPVDNYQITCANGSATIQFKTTCFPLNYPIGNFKLFQIVPIQNLDLEKLNFSVKASLHTQGCEALSIGAIMISYLDENKIKCGDTKIYSKDSSCVPIDAYKWPIDVNQSLYKVSGTSATKYSFNILDEIKKINGFRPDQISYIEVAFMIFGECYG